MKCSTVLLLSDERYAEICEEITQFTKHRWHCCKKRSIKLTTVHLVGKLTRTGAWCSVPRARVIREGLEVQMLSIGAWMACPKKRCHLSLSGAWCSVPRKRCKVREGNMFVQRTQRYCSSITFWSLEQRTQRVMQVNNYQKVMSAPEPRQRTQSHSANIVTTIFFDGPLAASLKDGQFRLRV